MGFNRNFKVQYKSKRCLILNGSRYLLYRIVPSELPFWKRIFCNEWKYARKGVYTNKTFARTVNDLISEFFTYDEAIEFINSHRTYGELMETFDNLYNKAVEHYNKIMHIDTRWNF